MDLQTVGSTRHDSHILKSQFTQVHSSDRADRPQALRGFDGSGRVTIDDVQSSIQNLFTFLITSNERCELLGFLKTSYQKGLIRFFANLRLKLKGKVNIEIALKKFLIFFI